VPNLLGKSLGDATRLLAAAGLAVAVVEKPVSGTAAGQVIDENPKPGQAAKAQDKVTLTVAELDLIAAAPSGTWTDGVTTLTFPTPTTSAPPAVRVEQDVALADNSIATVLLTQPVQSGQVIGELPVTGGIVNGDHLLASVGFLPNSDGTVDFLVMVNGQEVGSPLTVDPTTTTALTPLDVDLSSAAGAQSVQIVARASQGSTGQSYQAVWKDLRVSAGDK
jgi:hypothetical protein